MPPPVLGKAKAHQRGKIEVGEEHLQPQTVSRGRTGSTEANSRVNNGETPLNSGHRFRKNAEGMRAAEAVRPSPALAEKEKREPRCFQHDGQKIPSAC